MKKAVALSFHAKTISQTGLCIEAKVSVQSADIIFVNFLHKHIIKILKIYPKKARNFIHLIGIVSQFS